MEKQDLRIRAAFSVHSGPCFPPAVILVVGHAGESQAMYPCSNTSGQVTHESVVTPYCSWLTAVPRARRAMDYPPPQLNKRNTGNSGHKHKFRIVCLPSSSLDTFTWILCLSDFSWPRLGDTDRRWSDDGCAFSEQGRQMSILPTCSVDHAVGTAYGCQSLIHIPRCPTPFECFPPSTSSREQVSHWSPVSVVLFRYRADIDVDSIVVARHPEVLPQDSNSNQWQKDFWDIQTLPSVTLRGTPPNVCFRHAKVVLRDIRGVSIGRHPLDGRHKLDCTKRIGQSEVLVLITPCNCDIVRSVLKGNPFVVRSP